MGKSDFLTPKAIANRIKAKGLQKLRWYCQMCEKQCRDENGFKCHCTSESHQRQMALFAERPDKFMNTFSREFEHGFLDTLKGRHSTTRVKANQVYQEYISDRTHTHMNSTIWTSLTGFVKYLGRTGKCNVEETPKGWFISYIDRDPKQLLKQEALKQREKHELDEQERMQKFIDQQVQEAHAQADADQDEDTKLKLATVDLDPNAEKVTLVKTPILLKPKAAKLENVNNDSNKTDGNNDAQTINSEANGAVKEKKLISMNVFDTLGTAKKADSSKRKVSEIDKLIEENEKKKFKKDDKPISKDKYSSSSSKDKTTHSTSSDNSHWLLRNIIVKVLNKQLEGGKYYKAKGIVTKVVEDGKLGHVEILDSGDVLLLDSSQLETVIPQVNGGVKVLKGKYRGEIGTLVNVNFDDCCVDVKIEGGKYDNQLLKRLEYDDISKLA